MKLFENSIATVTRHEYHRYFDQTWNESKNARDDIFVSFLDFGIGYLIGRETYFNTSIVKMGIMKFKFINFLKSQ